MADTPLSDDRLGAILAQQIRLAKEHDRTEREVPRSTALEYFLGTMKDVPAEKNRSSVVSRDVADTMGWVMPQLMRVFCASDRMVCAEPATAADEQFADEVSDGLNYVFWKDNKGYELLYAASWDALLMANGIVKTYYDPTPVSKTSYHSGLTDDALAQLLAPDDEEDGEPPEVLAHSETQVQIPDPATGQPMPVTLHDVKIKREDKTGRFVMDCIAPEDFLIDSEAITTADARFKAQRRRPSRSDLVADGYDKDKVWSIPLRGVADTPEAIARERLQLDEATDKSTEVVDFYECFARLDVDGDGEAELVRACCAGPSGETLLDWEVWEDDDPFDDIPCEPMPHRWTARSLADETMDVQRSKTTLMRQGLNNIYATNNPQRFAKGKIVNMDELMNPSFGGVVMGDTASSIEPLEVPPVAQAAFDAMNYWDQVIQRRTGVGRQTMALDPEALTNQSATANQNEKDAAYSQVELVARNMAEFGWKKVFRKLMRLMVKHQDEAREIIVKGETVKIDPRFWNADMEVTIDVGLGTGSRDRDAQMLGTVLSQQIMLTDRLAAGGFPDKALDMLPYIHNTLSKFVVAVGLRNPEMYFPDVAPEDIAAGKQRLQQMQGQPSEQMRIAQLKAQSDERVQQSEAQSNAERARAEVQKAGADAQVKSLEAQLAAQKQQYDAQLAAAQLQVKQLEIAAKNQTEMRKAELAADAEMQVAEINAGNDAAATILEANLEAAAGFLDHQQQMERAAQAHEFSMAQQAAAPEPESPTP